MKSYLTLLLCTYCGQEFCSEERNKLCNQCGKVLYPQYDTNSAKSSFTKDVLKGRSPSMWRYFEMMPIRDPSNIVSLGERECSIQRRFQKIIEETPSPFIDDKLRLKLSKTAVDITKSSNYSGAGTVEFLVDKHNNYYDRSLSD